MLDRLDERRDQQRHAGKHHPRQKSHQRGQQSLGQVDDTKDRQDTQHREREEQPLRAGPEDLADDQIVDRDRGRQHPVIDLVEFQADEGPVRALEGRSEHRRRNEQAGPQKLDVGHPLHRFGDIRPEPQADPEQEQQRLQKRRQPVAQEVPGVDPHVAVPDTVQPLREPGIGDGLTASH